MLMYDSSPLSVIGRFLWLAGLVDIVSPFTLGDIKYGKFPLETDRLLPLY